MNDIKTILESKAIAFGVVAYFVGYFLWIVASIVFAPEVNIEKTRVVHAPVLATLAIFPPVFGGYVGGRLARRYGWLHGLIVGLVSMMALSLISEGSSNLGWLMLVSVLSILAGAAGELRSLLLDRKMPD